jgi:crossover junction endodeoxyribonuclease RuvC
MMAPVLAVVAGIDLSLSSTGVARAVISPERIATHTERITSQPTDRISSDPIGQGLSGRWLRLDYIADRVINEIGAPDLVLIESPTYAAQVTGAAHDRAGLWWIVLDRLQADGCRVVEVKASHLKIYAAGHGHATKRDVIAGARSAWGHLFDLAPRPGLSDMADAVTLAALGAHLLGHPLTELPQDRARAVALAKPTIPQTYLERATLL